MGNSHLLFEQLFKRDISANDTGDFLAELTKEHPYFTAAQFFLLQKTTSDSNLYKSQAAKTAILFNNPLWLNYQLTQLCISTTAENTGSMEDEADVTAVYDEEIEELEKVIPVTGDSIPEAVVEMNNEESHDGNYESIVEEEPIMQEPETSTPVELITEKQDVKEEQIVEENLLTAPKLSLETSSFTETTETKKELPPATANEISLLEHGISKEDDIPIVDPSHLIEQVTDTTLAEAETGPPEEFEATIINENSPAENPVLERFEMPMLTESTTERQIEHTDNTENGEDEEEEISGDLTDDNEIEPMNIRLNFTPDMPTTEETISFEPLHTSDYFASLGIKFNAEGKPVDKLGKQLKSFTEWLKTMKKIHTEQLTATTEQTDLVIQKMAEKSNADADVLTEAMAEVLFQQGKAGKAIEVYQKLSLLDPSKTAYFAAKIDQIER